jgi:hypothetical protein
MTPGDPLNKSHPKIATSNTEIATPDNMTITLRNWRFPLWSSKGGGGGGCRSIVGFQHFYVGEIFVSADSFFVGDELLASDVENVQIGVLSGCFVAIDGVP